MLTRHKFGMFIAIVIFLMSIHAYGVKNKKELLCHVLLNTVQMLMHMQLALEELLRQLK